MSNLVIVESPAKAKTIQKYLGKGYDVIASMGHIRDLPKSKLGVDVENGFQPKYTDMKGKEDVIQKTERTRQKSATISIWQLTRIEREKPFPGISHRCCI